MAAHLEVLHDFADAFPTGTNDTGMNFVVECNILGNHFLQLRNYFHDGFLGSFRIFLITDNSYLILQQRSGPRLHTIMEHICALQHVDGLG